MSSKAKKVKCPPPGAPDWLLTYGDLMSLLLCFFVILVALSELKKEDQYHAIVEKIQESFGMKGGGGPLPTQDDPDQSLIKILEETARQQRKEPNQSSAVDPGTEGKETTVTVVRRGERYIVGNRITFAPGSSQLTEAGRRSLRQIAERIRGYNNIVEIRGHASSSEAAEAAEGDLKALSFARAAAAEKYLTGHEGRVRADRLRLVACGDTEPLVKRLYEEQQRTPNRRVEVVVTGLLVEELQELESQ